MTTPAPKIALPAARPVKPKPRVHRAPPARKRPARRRHLRATPIRHRATGSRYMRTVSQPVLRELGCRAARRGTHGLVILDFGRLATRHRTLGTILFDERFASLRASTLALRAYAHGYARCARGGQKIVLARGTSNYAPGVASTYWAGRHWAAATKRFADYLERDELDGRVTSAAAIDAEPAWDRRFERTHGFFTGFRTQRSGSLLYNYGSLDGGPGAIWTVRQALYVAGGMRDARAVPEIYHREMARQWARLARLGVHRKYNRPVRFAGLMTQRSPGCGRCGMTPHQARAALTRELRKHPKTRAAVADLQLVTNIS